MNPARGLTRGLRSLTRRFIADVCGRGRRVPDGDRCEEADCESRPLTELEPGAAGTVSCLEDAGSRAGRKLAAMGLLPGVPVELLQETPVYVIRVRHTEFALDRQLARHVRVLTGEGGGEA